jgi:hypothetical protein
MIKAPAIRTEMLIGTRIGDAVQDAVQDAMQDVDYGNGKIGKCPWE